MVTRRASKRFSMDVDEGACGSRSSPQSRSRLPSPHNRRLQCAIARRGNRHLFVASLQCRVRFWGHNEASSPYAGLHFDSTTAALPALTTINKRLVFLEREKSIGRLRTSR
jgi:hypothetical protein